MTMFESSWNVQGACADAGDSGAGWVAQVLEPHHLVRV
jgi:hypothetical protein